MKPKLKLKKVKPKLKLKKVRMKNMQNENKKKIFWKTCKVSLARPEKKNV